MVLVDSSVFILAQRQPDSEDAMELRSLLENGEVEITGPVLMELIRGAENERQMGFIIGRLVSIDCLETDQQTWVIAGRLSRHLIRTGMRLPNMDVVIAATAIRHDVPLYTLDRGFDRIPELRLYQPT